LKEYMEDNQLPFLVSIFEDATAVVQKAEYSPSSNSMIGFSLPLRNNGLPDT
jgi:hypothetical protein